MMETLNFKAGETILAEGEDGNTAYLIVAGSVEVTVGTGGKAKRLATLGAGEVFGEMSLLEPGPRSATITAISDIACVRTSYDDFMTSIQDDPEQAILFMRTLVKRLRQTNEMMAALDPRKRGLREVIADWQKSVASADVNLSHEEIERKYALTAYLFW
ncbi:MAG: Crp/Fnr family transcriptional regulator [Devosia sp.]